MRSDVEVFLMNQDAHLAITLNNEDCELQFACLGTCLVKIIEMDLSLQ